MEQEKIIFKKNYSIKLAETLGQSHWYKIGKKHYPSSTTILQSYPFGQHLVKWIADHGYNESQEIKEKAGVEGNHVHNAIERLIKKETLYKSDYSLEEWSKLCAFADWVRDYSPKFLATETLLYSQKHGYAGRTDAVCEVAGKIVVADWKTSKSIYPHFALQVASYAHAIEEMSGDVKIDECAILQLGTKNKKNYRWALYPEWREHFKTFLNVKKVWEYENGITKDYEPPVLSLPDTLKLQ